MCEISDAERLDAIRDRCKNVDEGPWAWSNIGEKTNGYVVGVCWGPHSAALRGYQDYSNWDDDAGVYVDNIIEMTEIGDYEAATCNYGNPEFIAHSREDIPWLLEQLDAARALLTQYDANEKREEGEGCDV